jgi:multiple sugar transport system permease protein
MTPAIQRKKRIGLSVSDKKKRVGFLFSLPAFCFFLVFFLYPIVYAAMTSFTKWDMVHPRDYIGLENFIALLTNTKFIQALGVTLYFVSVDGIITIVLAFVLALILDSDRGLSDFFKAVYFLPSILSLTVVAVLFRYMCTPYGLITLIGETLFGVSLPWQSSFDLAMPSIIMMMVWNRVGFYMIIFVAGLKTIPKELYDAATIDGANRGVILRKLIIPLMNPVFLLAVILKMTEDFRHFAPFYLLTEGGPGRATTVLTLRIYRDGMEQLQMGKASAESMVAVGIMFVFTVIYLKLLGRETEY